MNVEVDELRVRHGISRLEHTGEGYVRL
jgi:hypothetical protein